MKASLSKYEFNWFDLMHHFYHSAERRQSYKTLYHWLAVECRANTDPSMDAIEFNTEQDKILFMMQFI